MDEAKIRLSEVEKELVMNAGWILTKNDILQKTMTLLGRVQQQYSFVNKLSELPGEVLTTSPKISRGENYRGLPWLMLDYPRCFGHEDVFAVRTMFWWGNFFSITLHLSGTFKKRFEAKISAAYEALVSERFFICIHENPWQHHFEKDNYLPVAELNEPVFERTIREKSFVKLAVQYPLQVWDESDTLLPQQFKKIITLLTD